MQTITIQHLSVSRLILGSNPFSGFSHQSPELDWEMRHYFTNAKIIEVLFQAEALGINTLIARTDYHVMRMLLEYRDLGGKLQWFAQTCPEVGSHETCIERAMTYGAKAVHIHGGVMDHLFAQGELDEIPAALDLIRRKGMLAGVAAHNPRVLEYVERHFNVDYYLACYYNPARRDQNAAHDPEAEEQYLETDRLAMTDLIQSLSKPVIHYKILAAGRNDPEQAFAFAASKMRSNDAVCVGVYPKEKPDMLEEDVRLLEKYLILLPKSSIA